jgi:hypothetical protein
MRLIRLFFVFACGLICWFASLAQVNVKDSLQTILRNDTLAPAVRFSYAYNTVFYNSSPQQAEALGLDVIYPFVEKNWDNHSDRLNYLSRNYLMIGFCHRERGGEDRNDQERHYLEKALETALKSKIDAVCAHCYNACAYMEIKRGDVKKAHEYLYKAIHYFDKTENYTKSSEMLYVIATNFHEIKDTDGLQRVLGQMEQYLQKDTSKQSRYQYNAIKHTRYGLLMDKQKEQGEVDYRMVDSSLVYIRDNVALVENHLDELSPNWMHGYAYYYLAKELDDYYPAQTDSIHLYLDRALRLLQAEAVSRTNESASEKELRIYLGTVRASALLREGRNQQAYKVLSETLDLLSTLEDHVNLNVMRSRTYRLMVEYYEKTGQPALALKYHKLLLENEDRSHEKEKVQAINDTAAKYETEKKEIRIQSLEQENKAARRILWLSVGLLLTLLTVSLLVVLWNRLKRRNVEQQLYETALLAELRQNELQELHNAKQQLEQDPVEHTIEKIAQLISGSLIEKDIKKGYLENISKIDPKLLEQAYRTSEEKVTGMELKYMVCFLAAMDVKDISLIFDVEPASVRTVRYRIRKKFPEKDPFRAIL